MKIWIAVFGLFGVVALTYWTFFSGRAVWFQVREKARFAGSPPTAILSDDIESQPVHRRLDFRAAEGSVIAMLSIPRLGLSAVVIEGSGEENLALGLGHIPGTAFPGTRGNTGVAGHRDTFFRPLHRVRKNDTIRLAANGREYQYAVVSTEIVEPGDISVLRQGGRDSLTLVTCYPFNFVGAAPKRFVVHADCVTCSVSDEE